MLKLIMLKGLPASGKTSWAKEFILSQNANSWKRINKDELRRMMDIGRWSQGSEDMVLAVRDSMIKEAFRRGCHVIVDDTNYNPAHETRLRAIAKEYGTQFEIKEFLTPVDECIKRDSLRGDEKVGEKVIINMYDRYVRPKEDKPDCRMSKIKWNTSLPTAIICDLDGCLADIGERNPYDQSTCDQDKVNEPVALVLEAMVGEFSYIPLFVSGRPDSSKDMTIEWLNKNNILGNKLVPASHLFMRKTGDGRKDAEVKKEIFEQEIKGKYNVALVLDDRDQVVNMWRMTLKLPCFQVSYGDF
jgi:predicted kinase